MDKFKKTVRKIMNVVIGQVAQDEKKGGIGSKEVDEKLVELARSSAAEGIVMLKNEAVLPLQSDHIVSVFGRVQLDYFAVGYGSGGDVNAPYVINLMDGLGEKPAIKINKKLAKIYEEWCINNKVNHGSWGNWPRYHEEMILDNTLVKQAACDSDIAIVIIGRAAGEDRENKLEQGSFYLTNNEITMLDKVTTEFKKVVVLINSGSIIDMSWMDRYGDKIDGLLYVWQGGMESGRAIADVLVGKTSPCGKLTDTIANHYEDYPSAKYFGNKKFNNYVEDIFVGYRYFETFAPEDVKYPFGYGLSYTEFKLETKTVKQKDGKITVVVTVTNEGNEYSGKEVVQIYYGAPQGRLGKPVKALVAYAKTKVLKPGESQELIFIFEVSRMASYDDGGKTGYRSAYVLEAGDYNIYVGNSVRNAEKKGVYHQKDTILVEQLTEAVAIKSKNKFKRIVAKVDKNHHMKMEYEEVPTATTSLKNIVLSELPSEIEQTGDLGYKLIDVKTGKVTMEEFVAQLSLNELEALSRGDYIMDSSLGEPGNAGVFGGILPSLRDKGIVPVTTTDGPSGIRLSTYASLLPNGIMLACTWNDNLIERLYQKMGGEMIEKGSHILLAPGMNIHRDPLCGRNFEYFSEDPLVTGLMASAVVKGIQSQKVAACPKHFACNNQETNRTYNDSRVSERALREIYLKGFEICMKESKPQNLMTAYNKINGVWGHYHYELCTTILRKEWKYKGNVMTDWWMRPSKDPDFPKLKNSAYRIRAQVDVLMPGGLLSNRPDPSLLKSYRKKNGITLGEMQRSAINVLQFIMVSLPFIQENE